MGVSSEDEPGVKKAGHPEGALAHLARAFDWQSRGDEFESRMLHLINNIETIIANRLGIDSNG